MAHRLHIDELLGERGPSSLLAAHQTFDEPSQRARWVQGSACRFCCAPGAWRDPAARLGAKRSQD